jgi:hypothetical protein
MTAISYQVYFTAAGDTHRGGTFREWDDAEVHANQLRSESYEDVCVVAHGGSVFPTKLLLIAMLFFVLGFIAYLIYNAIPVDPIMYPPVIGTLN